jgi:hypothetical protein
MNKNSRKLTQQELRNARFDGWFSREVNNEVDEGIWRKLRISTTGRARRMADVQFIAELLMIIIRKEIVGFDHDSIDNVYAEYDDLDDQDNPDSAFDVEKFRIELTTARDFVTKLYELRPDISGYLSSVANMYVLWAIIILDGSKLPDINEFANKYSDFMSQVGAIAAEKKTSSPEEHIQLSISPEARDYFDANQSATTEYPQRAKRLSALRRAFQIEDR